MNNGAIRGLVVAFVLATGLGALGCDQGLVTYRPGSDPSQGGSGVTPGSGLTVDMCLYARPAGCQQPCEKAGAILRDNCGACHAPPNAHGNPAFDFILEIHKLVSVSWYPAGGTPIRFVAPGRPDDSLIYMRAVILKDQPPLQDDPNLPAYPRVSARDGTVLRHWIADCLGEDPLTSSPDGTQGDAGWPPGDCPRVIPMGSCGSLGLTCQYGGWRCICGTPNWICT